MCVFVCVIIKLEDKRYKLSQEKLSGRCTLRISKNVKEDEGEYSCVIDEEEKTACYLYVEEPAFKFTKRLPAQIEANEYQNADIECEIEDENAECEWYFEGKVKHTERLGSNIDCEKVKKCL